MVLLPLPKERAVVTVAVLFVVKTVPPPVAGKAKPLTVPSVVALPDVSILN